MHRAVLPNEAVVGHVEFCAVVLDLAGRCIPGLQHKLALYEVADGQKAADKIDAGLPPPVFLRDVRFAIVCDDFLLVAVRWFAVFDNLHLAATLIELVDYPPPFPVEGGGVFRIEWCISRQVDFSED